MPHQCVRCNTFYEDGASEILKGCDCGGKLFFFVSKNRLNKSDSVQKQLSKKDREKIEKDVFEIVGVRDDKDAPVILDLESINVVEPGKFEIDLVHLFSKDSPLVYKLEDGKYIVDLARTFEKIGND